MEYEQLIPWVKPVEVSEDGDWKASNKAFRVIPGDYVTTEDGTGIVHIAPTLVQTTQTWHVLREYRRFYDYREAKLVQW